MKKKIFKILFHCDASIDIGMGHVVRCLALANELKNKYDCSIKFAMRKSTLGIKKVKQSYPVLIPNVTDNLFDYEKWLDNCIKTTESDILILDVRDGLSRVSLRNIKNTNSIKIVTIDDPEEKRLETDFAFYPPVPQVEELDWTGYKGKLFVGWDYVILREEFLKTYPMPKNTITDIFISMGGTDPMNMTQFTINALDLVKEQFSVTIVLGLGYIFQGDLLDSLSRVHYSYRILKNPENITEIMSGSDCAIISFGMTAYELVSLGVPSIYLCITEDHVISASLLSDLNCGINLGLYCQIDKVKLINSISKIIKDNEYRLKLSNNCRFLNLKNGKSNCATEIMKKIKK